MTENEEYQVRLVTNEKVMKQLVGCLQTPTFNHNLHINVLCCIENLLYNPSTHQHLCNPKIVRVVMNASDQVSDTRQVEDMDPALCLKLERDLVK